MRSKMAVSVAALAAGLALASSASAAVNLVANGGFETNGGNGQVNFSTTLDSWNVQALNTSYVFVFNPQAGTTSGTSADNAGAPGEYDHAPGPNLKLWGPGDGSNNGLSNSPDDGAFIAADPDYQNSAITQTVNGLISGQTYKLEFYFAGAQQFGYDGATTEGWRVSLGGGAAQNTATLTNASDGFTGWNKATMFFSATGASETLSFLATGGPAATLPPFALLDGVTMSETPEPATWALMIMGFGGIGAMVRNRRRQAAVA
jgi:hypothetical protein